MPLELGFGPIDRDHERVLALVAEVDDLIAAGAAALHVRDAFERMVDCTVAHFHTEELFMEAVGYPGLLVHRREHREITAWLLHLKESFQNAPPESIANLTNASTVDFLKAWVQQHLEQLDAPAVRFINRAHDQAAALAKPEERASPGLTSNFAGPNI